MLVVACSAASNRCFCWMIGAEHSVLMNTAVRHTTHTSTMIRVDSSLVHAHGSACLQVAAKYAGSSSSSSANVSLIAEGSPLVAALHGPSGRQPATAVLQLDASKSYDPDDPRGTSGALTFSWACVRQDFPALCFEGSYQVRGCTSSNLLAPHQPLCIRGLVCRLHAYVAVRECDCGSTVAARTSPTNGPFCTTKHQIITGALD
jgi:hypothetical protein